MNTRRHSAVYTIKQLPHGANPADLAAMKNAPSYQNRIVRLASACDGPETVPDGYRKYVLLIRGKSHEKTVRVVFASTHTRLPTLSGSDLDAYMHRSGLVDFSQETQPGLNQATPTSPQDVPPEIKAELQKQRDEPSAGKATAGMSQMRKYFLWWDALPLAEKQAEMRKNPHLFR